MVKLLTNPSGAFGQTDATSNQFQVAATYRANGTIVAGDGVALIWDETARTLLATQWDTDAAGQSAYTGVGVALNSAVVGEAVNVCVFGFALANIGSDTPALGENIIGSTTAGELASVAAAETTVAGSILGFALGDEDGTTNLVPMWVSPR